MGIEEKILRHPNRNQLVAFAESLVDGRRAVSAALAAHVSSCPVCAAETRAIRASLEFAASAPGLEPSNTLTGEILRNAQKARRENVAPPAPSPLSMALRGLACAAVLVLIAGITFTEAIREPQDSAPDLTMETAVTQEVTVTASLDHSMDRVRTLTAAVTALTERSPRSAMEHERFRMVGAMKADIAAAAAALERNPGCARAARIVDANLQRQAETLRNLYVERMF